MKQNNNRRYPGETTQHRPDFAKVRREEAAERQQFYNSLSVEKKIEMLDRKFGVGVGAARQRLKLSGTEFPTNAKLTKDAFVEIAEINSAEVKKPKMKAKDRRKKNNSSED